MLNMGKMTFRQRSKGSAKWVMKIIGGRAVQAERPPSAKDLRQERAQHGNTRSPCGCAVSPGEPSRGRRQRFSDKSDCKPEGPHSGTLTFIEEAGKPWSIWNRGENSLMCI